MPISFDYWANLFVFLLSILIFSVSWNSVFWIKNKIDRVFDGKHSRNAYE